MRIYTYILLSMQTFEVLEEESFEYEGPLDLCKGDSPDVPAQTPQQIQYQTLTNQALTQQMADQEAMKPLYAKSMGYTEDTTPMTDAQRAAELKDLTAKVAAYDASPASVRQGGDMSANLARMAQLNDTSTPLASGTYRPMTEDEQLAGMTPAQQQQYQASKLATQREIDALNGNLPVDPALTKSLDLQKQQLNETMAQKLGKDWQLSTPGATSKSLYDTNRSLIEEEARRGDITTMAGINNANQATALNTTSQNQNAMNTFDTRLLPMVGAYNAAQQPYQTQQGMQYNSNVIGAQNNTADYTAMLGAAGSAVGAATGMFTGASYLKAAKAATGAVQPG